MMHKINKVFFFQFFKKKRRRSLTHKYRTPLHYAADNNSKEMFELLISKGADSNAKDIRYYLFNFQSINTNFN